MLQAYKYDHQPPPESKKPELRLIPGGGLGGLDLFTCPNQPGNLRLNKSACITSFKRAQKADLESELSLAYCRECEIGSENAKIKIVPPIPRMCVRCERREMGMRLLSDILCISCWNRQSEVIKGRNARGSIPLKFKPLHIYDYDDTLIIVARNTDEASRVAERVLGHFIPESLVDYGQATATEIASWWSTIKQWSSRTRKPSTYNTSKSL